MTFALSNCSSNDKIFSIVAPLNLYILCRITSYNVCYTKLLRCNDYLERQITLHNPKIIILVGNYACKFFLGKNASISKIHGTFIEYEGKILFPVYHPAAILRNKNLKPIMIEDLNKLKIKIKTELLE